MIDRRLLTHFNWLMFTVAVALALIGLISVYSATFTRWPLFYKKERYWIIIGSVFLLASVAINYSLLERFAYFIYGSSTALLMAVLLMGRSSGGARRWLDLGLFSLQPSELSKLALIIMLAKYLSARPQPQKGLEIKDLAAPGLILMAPFLLIAKQPDLGTAIILWLIFWSIMLAVKIRKRTLVGIFAAFGAILPFAWSALKGYQKARLTSFLDPSVDPLGTGYHLMQSKIAIGSGGFIGKGFTKGTQGKLMFLPEHHTDFIFAVLAEEWGIIGSSIVLALFLTLVISGINTAQNSKDRFGFFLAYGVTAMLFWHAAINIAMVSGLMPVVGVPLPFISYGGSFLVTCMTGVGLLINVNMRRYMF